MVCCNDEDDFDESRDGDSVDSMDTDRSCTDTACCLIFLVCLLLNAGCACVAFTKGDARRILRPTNSTGQACEESRSQLVFFNLVVCARLGPAVANLGCPTPQVCVAKCPNAAWMWPVEQAKELAGASKSVTRSSMVCLDSVNPSASPESIENLVKSGKCAPYLLPSDSVLGRCIPRLATEAARALKSGLTGIDASDIAKAFQLTKSLSNKSAAANEAIKLLQTGVSAVEEAAKMYGTLQIVFQDAVNSCKFIAFGFFVSIAVCIIWVLLLRLLAKPMIALSILAFIALLALVTSLAINRYLKLKSETGELETGIKFALTIDLSYYTEQAITWLILSVTAGWLLIIMVLMVWCLRKKIILAGGLIEEASRTVSHMMSALVFPVIPFAMQLIIIAYAGALAMYIKTMGNAGFRAVSFKEIQALDFTNLTATQATDKAEDLVQRWKPCNTDSANVTSSCHLMISHGGWVSNCMQLFNVFMFLWLFNFVDALCQMTLAGAFASFYFAKGGSGGSIPAFPLLASFWRCVRYHLGSIAFGSLILSIVQFIRLMLEYLDEKLKNAENPVAKFFMKCLKCCFWCLEKCLKFLNRNAYILIAIQGCSFCSAAREAFSLILRNFVRVAVVNRVAAFILFISKLVMVGLMVVALKSVLHFTDAPFIDETKAHSRTLWILLAVLTYCTASLFMSVFSTGVDSLFLCFLKDLENGGRSSAAGRKVTIRLQRLLGQMIDSQSDAQKSTFSA